ncbi:MAG: DUF6588 family protein [Balneolales bacterium]
MMRSITTLTFLSLFLLLQAPRTHAQLGDAGEMLRASTEDANLLLENYLQPFGSGFGAGLNAGWFNSAKPYGKFGFDLRAGASIALVPSTGLVFNAFDQTYQSLEYLGGPVESQTISGDDISGTTLGQTFTYTHPVTNEEITETLFQFDMPAGTGLPYVPAPMAQLSIGLIKDTEVAFRFMPVVDIEDVASIGLWGIGVKHGLNQWIPGGSTMPVDIALQFGHTSLTAEAFFEVDPQMDADTENSYSAATWEDQGIKLQTSGSTYNLLVGKNLPFISLYGGLGYQSSVMAISTPGSYPITIPNADYDPSVSGSKIKKIDKVDEPIDFELIGENSFHATGGLRLRLALITISASYTLADYPVANVGVGLSFR